MAWVSPTGHNDPGNKWSDETLAYDENTNTGADTGTLSAYLELSCSAISCDKIRVMILEYKGGTEYDNTWCGLNIYYDSAWRGLYDGYIDKNIWTEFPIGSTETVTGMRLYYKLKSGGGAHLLWKEADFWEVEAPPSYISQIIMVT